MNLSKYFATIGAKGGSATSEEKAQSAKLNGAKGGRPRKKRVARAARAPVERKQ